jgi:hypothetical protein
MRGDPFIPSEPYNASWFFFLLILCFLGFGLLSKMLSSYQWNHMENVFFEQISQNPKLFLRELKVLFKKQQRLMKNWGYDNPEFYKEFHTKLITFTKNEGFVETHEMLCSMKIPTNFTEYTRYVKILHMIKGDKKDKMLYISSVISEINIWTFGLIVFIIFLLFYFFLQYRTIIIKNYNPRDNKIFCRDKVPVTRIGIRKPLLAVNKSKFYHKSG